MQKKAYRVLEEVCAAPHAPCQAFVRSHLQELQAALLDSLKSAASPAKRVRARAAVVELSHGWEREGVVQAAGPARCPSLGVPVLGCFFPQPRLKCLFHIVKQLSVEHEPFITALVPEVSMVPGGTQLVLAVGVAAAMSRAHVPPGHPVHQGGVGGGPQERLPAYCRDGTCLHSLRTQSPR